MKFHNGGISFWGFEVINLSGNTNEVESERISPISFTKIFLNEKETIYNY